MNKYRHTKRRKKKTGNQETIFAGNDCEWIDLCGLKTSAGNCSDGNKAVIKNAKGARKQFLIVDGKVLYGFVKFKKKFASCQGVKERTASVNCKYVAKSDVSSIPLRTSKLPKIKVHDKPSKKGAYTGKECQYVDICSVRSAGQGCVDGSKFVLKSGGGVRKQFLITNNKLILAFVTFGKQFADCQSFTDVTSSITCKAVDNLSGFKLTTPTPAPSVSSSTSTTTITTVAAPPPPCKCGVKKEGSRIYGGSDAQVNEYPWIVAFARNKKGKITFFCGGSLISSRWVVTAGHCLTGAKTLSNSTLAIIGAITNHQTQQEDLRQVIEVTKIIIHPNFGTSDDYEYEYDDYAGETSNDIGLAQLVRAVDISVYTPICLPQPTDEFIGKMGWVIGWGSQDTEAEYKENWINLQEVQVPIIDDITCKTALEAHAYDYNLPPIQILDGMICGGGIEGQDACKGDQGGPLSHQKDGQHQLVGIVSWGLSCGREGLYWVYTEVGKYREWLDAQLGGNGEETFCND